MMNRKAKISVALFMLAFGAGAQGQNPPDAGGRPAASPAEVARLRAEVAALRSQLEQLRRLVGPGAGPGAAGPGAAGPRLAPLPAPASPPSEESRTDLDELLRRVAGSSGREFLVDARVPARISVRGTAVNDPSYALLLSILRANDLAAVQIDDRTFIVSVDEARQLPTRLVETDDANIPDDEWVTRVLEVPGRGAANLVPILRPMLPQQAHLAALIGQDDAQSSKLVIVDRYANVRRITQLVVALTGR